MVVLGKQGLSQGARVFSQGRQREMAHKKNQCGLEKIIGRTARGMPGCGAGGKGKDPSDQAEKPGKERPDSKGQIAQLGGVFSYEFAKFFDKDAPESEQFVALEIFLAVEEELVVLE